MLAAEHVVVSCIVGVYPAIRFKSILRYLKVSVRVVKTEREDDLLSAEIVILFTDLYISILGECYQSISA